MRPLHLTIRGVTRFRSSLELDLEQAPEGLIAVVGPNGAGKTTLLEAMAPGPLFLDFPSRSGSLRDVCHGRDAVIDLVLSHEGRTYRALVQVDTEFSAGRGKTEAFLFEGSEPMNDGKIGTYAEAVARVFPPRSVLLASAFAAQGGAGNFLALDTINRKALFASLLGLEELQGLSDRAAVARRPFDGVFQVLEERAATLERDRTAAAAAAAELEQVRAGVAAATALEQGCAAAEGQARAALAVLQAQLGGARQARATALARVSELERRREGAREARRTVAGQVAVARQLLNGADEIRARATRRDKLQGERDSAATDYRVLDEQIRATERRGTALLSDRTRGRAQVAALAGEVELLEEQERQLEEQERQLEALGLSELTIRVGELEAWLDGEGDHLLRTVQAAAQAHAAALTRLGELQAGLEAARRQAELLGGVPCEGRRVIVLPADVSTPVPEDAVRDAGACLFLLDALEASERLPQLEAELGARQLELVTATGELAGARSAAVDVETRTDELAQARDQVVEAKRVAELVERLRAGVAGRARARAELEEVRARTAALELEELEVGRELVPLRTKLEALKLRGRGLRQELEVLAEAPLRLQELEQAQAQLPALEQAAESHRTVQEDAQAQLEQTPVPPHPSELETQVSSSERQLERLHLATEEARAGLRELDRRRGKAEGRLEQVGDLTHRGDELEEVRARAGRRRSGFDLVAKAFGRSGIQALEIDAAGPEVSLLIDRLLEAVVGPRWSVQLRTVQEATAGRRQREVFDLAVVDGRGGGARQHAALSGGEQVLISEALKLALAVFNARRWGHLSTIWRDECDGALDPVIRAGYPAMLRAALELSGATRCFFVTHNPGVADQADAVLNVEGGRAWLT